MNCLLCVLVNEDSRRVVSWFLGSGGLTLWAYTVQMAV